MRLGVWFGAVVALCTVALAMLVLTLAVVAWQLGQIVGLIGLSLILLAAAGIAYWQFHKRFKQGPAPFSATLDEFKKDREWLRGQKNERARCSEVIYEQRIWEFKDTG